MIIPNKCYVNTIKHIKRLKTGATINVFLLLGVVAANGVAEFLKINDVQIMNISSILIIIGNNIWHIIATSKVVLSLEHSSTNAGLVESLALLTDLRRALNAPGIPELSLVYQPKIYITSERISGVETLLRWEHPLIGMIPPDTFIKIAEQSGLIDLLTARVVEMSMQQYEDWANIGIKIPMSINISVNNLCNSNILNTISSAIIRHNVDPRDLTLEVTETSVMLDHDVSVEMLVRLNAMGIKLSIDDFGTGHSSFIYLKHLPIKEIKIDKSFVFGVLDDSNDVKIIQRTIDLAHDIGCHVVAEGIETQEVLDKLTSMGCDQLQGFYISKPLTPEDLVIWYKASLLKGII